MAVVLQRGRRARLDDGGGLETGLPGGAKAPSDASLIVGSCRTLSQGGQRLRQRCSQT
jgi:hypothetical protein